MIETERTDIGYMVKRISDRIRTHADARLSHFELTFSQMRVLGCIDSCGGMATQKQIEEALDVAHPTVVGLVGRLAASGFVGCTVDENDRRHKKIRLLPKAYAIEQEIRADRLRSEQILTSGMSPEEVEALCRLLDKVYENIEKYGEGQEERR